MTIVSANIEDALAFELETFCKASGITMSSVIKSLLIEKLHDEPSIVTIYRDISEKFNETNRKIQTIGAILTAMMRQELILETLLQVLTAYSLGDQYRGRTMPENLKTFIEKLPEKMKTNSETMKKLEEALDDFNKTQEGQK